MSPDDPRPRFWTIGAPAGVGLVSACAAFAAACGWWIVTTVVCVVAIVGILIFWWFFEPTRQMVICPSCKRRTPKATLRTWLATGEKRCPDCSDPRAAPTD